MPYAKVILGPRYAVRLSDLLASDCVVARCASCEKTWRIATHRLYDRFRPEERMVRIGELMKCDRCKTGAIIWGAVYLAPRADVRRPGSGAGPWVVSAVGRVRSGSDPREPLRLGDHLVAEAHLAAHRRGQHLRRQLL